MTAKTFAEKHPNAFKVLLLLKDVQNYLTIDEIHELHIKNRPRYFHWINKAIRSDTLPMTDKLVTALHKVGFLDRVLTRFTNQPLLKDTSVYKISDAGKRVIMEHNYKKQLEKRNSWF